MQIVCPYCRHAKAAESTRPGRYTARCSRCGQSFSVTVAEDASGTAAVAPLSGGQADPTVVVPVLAAELVQEPSVTLGGYQVLRQLGKGGMGTVYLARQLSLGRMVALKVLDPRWATDPAFLARFTREAYAAAQLVHPNIVHIYDIGSDRGLHYFSMEYVEGPSLAELVRTQGKLDPETAAGYLLQAARGLKFGHDRGMVHRDVKPDNLLLSDQGVIKVADLGLVKTPNAPDPDAELRPAAAAAPQVTQARQTVGTPAYMAPEQARDAARVDARADVYALGCTLYVLLTGRPPFQGSTVLEVLSRHAFEAVVPPDTLVKEVPPALSAIIVKMVAKKPEDRYADMGEVITALEDFLGVQASGRFTPRAEHAALLAEHVRRFNAAPAARRRGEVVLGFFAGCALAALLGSLLGWWRLTAAVTSLAVLTPLWHFVVNGVARRTYLFGKVRELVLLGSWTDGLVALVAGGLLLLLLWLFHGLGLGLACFVLAASLAVTFYILIDRPVAARQEEPVEQVQEMLRGMRLHGLGEEALGAFIYDICGERGEAFYEALFGYEALVAARARREKAGQGMPRAAPGRWRAPVVAWIDARLSARRAARERLLLEQVEQAAEAQERRAEGPKEGVAAPLPVAIPVRADGEPDLLPVQDLLGLPEPPKPVPASKRRRRAVIRFLNLAFESVLGAKVRFLVGAVLLAGCIGWVYQNDLVPGQEIQRLASDALDRQDVPDLSGVNIDLDKETRPLSLPYVPTALTALFDGFNGGAAALILFLSMVFHGWRVAVFAWPAALIAFVGHRLGMPALEPLSGQGVSMIVGAVLLLPGLVLAARTVY